MLIPVRTRETLGVAMFRRWAEPSAETTRWSTRPWPCCWRATGRAASRAARALTASCCSETSTRRGHLVRARGAAAARRPAVLARGFPASAARYRCCGLCRSRRSDVRVSLGSRSGRFPNAFAAAMLGVILSQPVGRLVQERLTTSPTSRRVEMLGTRVVTGNLRKVLTSGALDDTSARGTVTAAPAG